MEKRCIFHIPDYLDPDRASASQIRPRKMIKAFEQIGYRVDIVQGYGKQRKIKIEEIRRNVKYGVKYDFLYSESSTTPTLLTERHHLPVYPFLDFNFFKFIKKHKIKIGLFYRDMYWKFPEYKNDVNGIKNYIACWMYRYDLRKYKKLLDKFYLPTVEGYIYLENEIPNQIIDELPPGCEYEDVLTDNGEVNKEKIVLLYVGGLGAHYRIHDILKAVNDLSQIELIICCRKDEWEKEYKNYEQYIGKNIHICHESGKGLEKLYKKINIGLLYFEPSAYRKIAIPYKAFEYLGHGLPVIASEGTAIGDWVKKKNIGWTIEYNENVMKDTLLHLIYNHEEILDKKKRTIEEIVRNTWIQRAKKVERDLCSK